MLLSLLVAEFATSLALFCRSTARSFAPPMTPVFSPRTAVTFLASLLSSYKTALAAEARSLAVAAASRALFTLASLLKKSANIQIPK